LLVLLAEERRRVRRVAVAALQIGGDVVVLAALDREGVQVDQVTGDVLARGLVVLLGAQVIRGVACIYSFVVVEKNERTRNKTTNVRIQLRELRTYLRIRRTPKPI